MRARVQRAFWRSLEAVGVKNARRRWEGQSPILQRAVPPLVIAALVLLVAWALGVPPHPTLLALLAIVYALYLLPPRIRKIALPLMVLGVAIVYPVLWANELNGMRIRRVSPPAPRQRTSRDESRGGGHNRHLANGTTG